MWLASKMKSVIQQRPLKQVHSLHAIPVASLEARGACVSQLRAKKYLQKYTGDSVALTDKTKDLQICILQMTQ